MAIIEFGAEDSIRPGRLSNKALKLTDPVCHGPGTVAGAGEPPSDVQPLAGGVFSTVGLPVAGRGSCRELLVIGEGGRGCRRSGSQVPRGGGGGDGAGLLL